MGTFQQIEGARARLSLALADFNYDLNELHDDLELLYELVDHHYWEAKAIAAYRATFTKKEATDAIAPPTDTDPLHY